MQARTSSGPGGSPAHVLSSDLRISRARPRPAESVKGDAGQPMTKRFAEGLNYSIDLEGSTAICRVWSRPDLDSAQGAQLAREKVAIFRGLAHSGADGMLFDLTLAPAVTGPKTQKALGDMLGAFEAAGKPIALVTGQLSIQQLQLRRLLATYAPQRGALFTSQDEALAWLVDDQRRT